MKVAQAPRLLFNLLPRKRGACALPPDQCVIIATENLTHLLSAIVFTASEQPGSNLITLFFRTREISDERT